MRDAEVVCELLAQSARRDTDAARRAEGVDARMFALKLVELLSHLVALELPLLRVVLPLLAETTQLLRVEARHRLAREHRREAAATCERGRDLLLRAASKNRQTRRVVGRVLLYEARQFAYARHLFSVEAHYHVSLA